MLAEAGRGWGTDPAPLRALPVNPSLARVGPRLPAGLTRVQQVNMFKPVASGEAEATVEASLPDSSLGRIGTRVRRALIGPPLLSSAIVHERMRKAIALPVLSSDLLSSVAYGPEALLSVLVLAGAAGLGSSIPLAALLVTLMLAVGASYRQTIRAYPSGAGSYLVAGDNLGEVAAVCAAVGLLTDYVLTVAVSIAAGVAAITSAAPSLQPDATLLGLAAIALLLCGNLRGVRQAGNVFALPTYLFLAGIGALIVVGLAHFAGRHFTVVPAPHLAATAVLTPVLIARAFASGATSMTGIEAVSNAVPAFQPVQWRNARTTLTWMILFLVTSFAGIVVLTRVDGVVPTPGQTVLSELAHRSFGSGFGYFSLQGATAAVLLLAANTSFNGLPRVLYFMARNHHAPRAFLRMGDRLAFSNGIIALALMSAIVFAGFGARTAALIPLYAVGVFLAFTLCQAGMVVHWWRRRGEHWRRAMAVNALGAFLSAVVLVTAAVTKFAAGAWIVVLGIPLLAALLLGVRRHYANVRERTAVRIGSTADLEAEVGAPDPNSTVRAPAPGIGRTSAAIRAENAELPADVLHLVVAAVAQLDHPTLRALAYARSLGQPLLALHVSPEQEEVESFKEQWGAWGAHVPLEVVLSPYRAIVAPMVHYLESLHSERPELTITVVVSYLEVPHLWQRLLHSRTGARLRRALARHPGIVIAEIPFHLPSGT